MRITLPPFVLLVNLAGIAYAAPSNFRRPCGQRIAPCSTGFTCVPNDKECTNLDRCLGTCAPEVIAALSSAAIALPDLPTPSSASPVQPTPSIQNGNDYQPCGLAMPEILSSCPEGSHCAVDPRSTLSSLLGIGPKICIPDSASFCGGFAGIQCPEGLQCYDVPNDGCDVRNGGADCGGVCL
ncbi:hypothetical protein B0I35DRAFT_157283 [Stachybotrys elegans]|uniref:Uncharacterized protein n=1 Tax=Stachybotrys elegans TaxID=80388 RepID=A0A8K0SSU3_9HYPO|nr:hypothetical protein B0I35DRAFT_157283 [Stachybotrys elegans]